MKTIPTIKDRTHAYKVLDEIETERANNRAEEIKLRARLMTAKSNPVIDTTDLAGNLAKILPPHVAPKNVGRYDSLMWDFSYPVVFDFGNNPTFDRNTRKQASFRVNQEGAFLLCGISWVYQSKLNAGKGAPLLMSIMANQMDKRYNDAPFPIQNIGTRGNPLTFPLPMLVQKNTTVSIDLTSFLTGNEEMVTTGDGYHEFCFFGMKVRNEEDMKLIQTLFT